MKRITLLLILLLVTSVCYAQVARNSATNDHAGKSNFSSVGVQGLDVTGNPGYIELLGMGGRDGVSVTYYLWVQNGNLMIASRTTMTTASILFQASFPNGNWSNISSTTVVGSQS